MRNLELSFDVITNKAVSIDADVIIAHGGGALYPIYDGAYEVTPTQEEQILYTQNKVTINNITVHPIPSNYGLITWNGSFLKVS